MRQVDDFIVKRRLQRDEEKIDLLWVLSDTEDCPEYQILLADYMALVISASTCNNFELWFANSHWVDQNNNISLANFNKFFGFLIYLESVYDKAFTKIQEAEGLQPEEKVY